MPVRFVRFVRFVGFIPFVRFVGCLQPVLQARLRLRIL